MLSPEVLTTMHILLMRHSGIQKEIFDLLVTTIWWSKTPDSAKLFSNSEEDVIGDTKDPFTAKFVTTATWCPFKTKNLYFSELSWSFCILILDGIRVL